MQICIGRIDPVYYKQCEKTKPFCVNNVCTSEPDYNRTECLPQGFICTGKGYYPDPSDCSMYRYCSATNAATSIVYKCPSGYEFDSFTDHQSAAENLQCRSTSEIYSSIMCRKFDCKNPNNTNRLIVYQGNSAIYAFCASGLTDENSIDVIVYKCQGDREHFDLESGQCIKW